MGPPEMLTLLLADARLPVAGHTQSGTLEGAVMAGLSPGDVPSFVRTRLLGITRVEAGTAVVARALVLDGRSALPAEQAWAARTVAPAVRNASRLQGRALLRLVTRLWPDAMAGLAHVAGPSRSVVLGGVGAYLGLSAEQVARCVAYDDVQTVCAAALKLLPLDPSAVTGWVVDLLPAAEEVVDAVSDLKDPVEIPALAAPQIEAWAQAHAATTRRLFRA